MNGRIHGELKDPLDPPEDIIRQRLALLDGVNRYSFSLWRLPERVPFERVDLDRWPQEYIQAAGSKERLTVEIRRIEGIGRQYVVGKCPPAGPMSHQVAIHWSGYETCVQENEVFTAVEAAEVFVHYYATGRIPEVYALRNLVL